MVFSVETDAASRQKNTLDYREKEREREKQVNNEKRFIFSSRMRLCAFNKQQIGAISCDVGEEEEERRVVQ